MRRLFQAALALAAFAMAPAACTADVAQDEGHLSSCDGAALDDGGTCRKPNGHFARKACCAVDTAPTQRRDLSAYACESTTDVPVAFFDADSTLRISKGGTPTANAPDDVYVLPFVAARLTELGKQGMLVAIVSNQGGVAAGYTPFEVAEGGLVYAGEQLTAQGAKIDYLDFADQKDEFRKPKVGMAEHLEGLLQDKCGHGIDWANSFMVGDAGYKKNVDGPHPDGRPADDFSNSDRGFAENLGIPFEEPTDYFGWRDWGFYNVRYESQLLGLLDAMSTEADELDASGDNPDRASMLRAEVAANRAINGLD